MKHLLSMQHILFDLLEYPDGKNVVLMEAFLNLTVPAISTTKLVNIATLSYKNIATLQ